MEIVATVLLILTSLLLSFFLLGAAAKGWRKLRKSG